jgi:hypothetical protein
MIVAGTGHPVGGIDERAMYLRQHNSLRSLRQLCSLSSAEGCQRSRYGRRLLMSVLYLMKTGRSAGHLLSDVRRDLYVRSA